MICFFALQPDADTRLQIADWRDRNLPPLDHPVSAANFHITLAYLGQVADWQLDEILHPVHYGDNMGFNLILDQAGYWPKPRVLWLGTTEVPESLLLLARQLNRIAGSLRLRRDRRPYHPHLTLARKHRTPPPAPTESPYFSLSFDRFVLMESCRSPAGVNYRVLENFV